MQNQWWNGLGSNSISRRSLLKMAGASAAALSLGGLSAQKIFANTGPRKNLVVGLFGEPAGLNEFLRTGVHGSQVTTNIYNKLARINPNTRQVEPELATRWFAEDPLTWVIELREGVMWHKGYGEFTAEDVVYTFNYILDNNTFQLGASLFPVERARVRDKYTVEVKLKEPFAPFPTITMEYGGTIMCKAAHEEMGPERYARNPIGTGPFEFQSWVAGSHILLTRNENYWKPGLPHLDEVVFRIIPDAAVRLASLRRGEIDLMGAPDPKDIPQIRAGRIPGIKYSGVPGWNWDYMAFTFPPHIAAEFPTQLKNVRQAISYAIDREILVEEIYAGEALVTDSPVPPGYASYRPTPIKYPAQGDVEKARELMRAAGVSGFELEIITSDKEWLRRETELVAAMLSEIGIDVRVQGLDVGTWTDRWINQRNFQALLEDITIVSPDVDSAVFWFHRTGTVGHHGWSRPDVDELLDAGRAVYEQEERNGIYHQIVDAILDDCPYIYLSHVNQVYLLNERISGFEPSPQEIVLQLENVHWT